MSRNGTGTMTVLNTFTPGDTITASQHNQNWSDAASELTNSVAADGQTSMTGPLKAASGTAAAPTHTFAADTDSGMYRVGANEVGIAVGGTKILDVSSTALDVTGEVKRKGIILQPVGIVHLYAGTAAPSGWLLCYGQSLLIASYTELFAAIGTTFGAADGSHFSLPDLRGRLPFGKDDMGGAAASRLTSGFGGVDGATLGAVGGSQVHTLTQSELPSSIGTITINNGAGLPAGATNTTAGAGVAVSVLSNATSFVNVTASITNGSGGNAHAIVPPAIVFNYIIFAGV